MSPRRQTRTLLWFGVLGSPAAWVVQFVFGYAVTEAACDAAGTKWGIPVDAWAAIATVVAGVIATLAGVAALATFRATRDRGSEPPAGRIHFLATVGITLAPLFLCIIVLNGIGTILLTNCHQS
jgi:nitrate reductase gamma subunit